MAPSTTFTAIYTNSTSLSPSFSLTKHVPTTTSTSSPMTTSDRAKYLHELRQIAATFQDDINRELTQRMEEDNKRAAAASGGKSKAEEEEAAKEEENYGEEVVEEDE
ncbi:EKC/KEOPS complex, subunit Gon7 [Pseudoneurospora amorphoporcata]|uniref:EKC/KEOPS complex subunit GON7 n=1 Tax=Pseudoneurospora amorphoporcata TaxID=241081 RepID=A0AAN6SIX9_9PEZI|nr:EKC/KEOPS complex, subunit Gon7 [Pseudoneurospora amorphoporcata]